MLPTFPTFKKLELSDRTSIESYTQKFDPYSNYNFIEMWSWNIHQNLEFCELNGNLIIRPNDYFDNEHSLSYLGNNDLKDTVEKLFAYLILQGVTEPKLKYIPEVSLSGIELDRYIIEIDLANCDYIYNISDLSKYEGPQYKHKRKLFNRFERNHPRLQLERIDVSDVSQKNQLFEFSEQWMQEKTGDEFLRMSMRDELKAINRFFDGGFDSVVTLALYEDKNLLGYQIFSLLLGNYTICHFGKSIRSLNGSFEYMMSATASILKGMDVKYLNTAEDLGLLQLRSTKNSYRPINFLRKYTIRQR